jgi:hypothetical protein
MNYEHHEQGGLAVIKFGGSVTTITNRSRPYAIAVLVTITVGGIFTAFSSVYTDTKALRFDFSTFSANVLAIPFDIVAYRPVAKK